MNVVTPEAELSKVNDVHFNVELLSTSDSAVSEVVNEAVDIVQEVNIVDNVDVDGGYLLFLNVKTVLLKHYSSRKVNSVIGEFDGIMMDS